MVNLATGEHDMDGSGNVARRVAMGAAALLFAATITPLAAVAGERPAVDLSVGQLSISSVAGNYGTFTTTITNIGTITLSSFWASEITPAGLVGDAAETGGVVGWEIGDPYEFAITTTEGTQWEGGRPIDPLAPGESYIFERMFFVEGLPGQVLTHQITVHAAEVTADPVVANPCPNDPNSACASITIPTPLPTAPVGITIGVCVLPSVTLCDPSVDILWSGYGDDVGQPPVLLPSVEAVYKVTVSNPNTTALTGVEVALYGVGYQQPEQKIFRPAVSVSQGDVSMFPGKKNPSAFDTYDFDFPAWKVGTIAPGAEATLVFRTQLPVTRGDTNFGVLGLADTQEGFGPKISSSSAFVTVGTQRQFVRSLVNRAQSSAVIRNYLRAL